MSHYVLLVLAPQPGGGQEEGKRAGKRIQQLDKSDHIHNVGWGFPVLTIVFVKVPLITMLALCK